VHVDDGAIVPLFNVTDLLPLAAVKEAELPQPVRDGETGSARKTLSGRVSVNEAWVRLADVWLLVITIVNWLMPPVEIVLGLNRLLSATGGRVGGGGVGEGGCVPVTFNVALAGLVLVIVVPPPVAESSRAGIVLIRFSPAAVEVTLMVTEHRPGVAPV
jgi:hypothetical protein